MSLLLPVFHRQQEIGMSFTPHLFQAWEEQSRDNPNELYESVIREINNLFCSFPVEASQDLTPDASPLTFQDEQIRAALVSNVNYMFGLCGRLDFFGRPDEEVRTFARDSLINTRLMLSFIDECVTNYTVCEDRHGFFSKNRLPIEIAKGGHVVIRGGAALFDVISELGVSHFRFSSHYREQKMADFLAMAPGREQEAEAFFLGSKPDCSIQAPGIFNELLFGKVGNDLWFQTEAHGHESRAVYGSRCLQFINTILNLFRYSVEKFLHHVDYLKYMAGGKAFNVGPYGNSTYVESDPIYLVPAQISLL